MRPSRIATRRLSHAGKRLAIRGLSRGELRERWRHPSLEAVTAMAVYHVNRSVNRKVDGPE